MHRLRNRIAPVAALALLSVPISAQSIPPDSLGLPEAVVVADRAPVSPHNVGHTFDILTGGELRALPVTTVAEALQYVGGLDLRQRGPRGVQADLSIRGGTFDQVLILVNGIKLADPQTGHHNMNIPVPLENVERIEVIKGPGARLYGQNAFAGAVNVITRPARENGLGVRGEFGDNGLAGFGVSADVVRGRARNTLTYSRDLSAGYRYNTDYVITNAFYQGELPTALGTFGAIASINDRAFGANGFYASPDFADQFERITTSLVALTHRQSSDGGSLTQRLSWRRGEDEYIFVRDNPSLFRNLHISHTYGYDGFKTVETSLGRLGLGAEVQGVALSSNNLGQRERAVVNLVADHEFRLLENRLRVTPGLTLNYLSDAGSRLLPGVDAAYSVSERLEVYGNVGMTYRVPTYTDLYYADRANVGNPDLVAERAYAYEAGAHYRRGALELGGALWQREALDLIDYVRDSAADTVWQPRNVTEATFRGVELSAAVREVTAWLPLARLSYNYIDAGLPDDGEATQISRYALDQLRHQLIATVVGRIAAPLTATLTYRYADRVTEPAAGALPLDYQLLDLRVDYRHSRYNAFAEASNALDEAYSQANGVPLPGRWVRLGAGVRL